MFKYIIKRLLISIPVFLGITLCVFIMSSLAPGSPADRLAAETGLTQLEYDALEKSLGLDKPILVRYVIWLKDFVRGDLGNSYDTGKSVSKTIGNRLGPTLLLTGTSLLIAILVAVPLGVLMSRKPYGKLDYFGSGFSFLGQAVPTFFSSLILIYLFAVKLKILPISGMIDANGKVTFIGTVKHLVMPVFVLSWLLTANLLRYTRASMLEVFNEEYVKTARSKGITESRVMIKHVLRNGLIPIVTAIGLQVPFLFGGACVVEKIFTWPGIGSLLVNSITTRDYPVIMGITCMIAIVVLVTNLVLDIIYAALDPRIAFD